MGADGNIGDRTAVWWLAAAGVAVVLAVPFFLVDVPPVLDYPNHLARIFILARGAADPVLSRIYAPAWRIVPNLGMDIVGVPLMRLLPANIAGRMLLALAAFLPVAGVTAYHRATFGVRTWWPLASAIVAFNGVFLLGFVSFLYAIGLAFLAAALWTRLVDRRPGLTLVLSVLATVVLFFCHLFGVLLFALLIASHEAAMPSRRSPLHFAMLVAALVPAAVLYLMSPLGSGVAPPVWDSPREKLVGVLAPFLTYHQSFGLAVAVAVLALFILLWRDARIDRASAIAFVVLAAAFAVAPSAVGGGTFVDTRLPVIMAFLAFAGFRPLVAGKRAAGFAIAVALVLVARMAEIASVWYGHRSDIAELRVAIAPVEPGAKVLVVSAAAAASPEYLAAEPAGRFVPGLHRTDLNIASLLITERRAFWPLLFADPRQQPVRVVPPYDVLAGPLGEIPDYRRLAGDGVAGPDAPYLADWQQKFDYVLVIDAGAIGDPAAVDPDQLDLLEGSDMAALYRVHRL